MGQTHSYSPVSGIFGAAGHRHHRRVAMPWQGRLVVEEGRVCRITSSSLSRPKTSAWWEQAGTYIATSSPDGAKIAWTTAKIR